MAGSLLVFAGARCLLFPYLDSQDAAAFEAAGFPVSFADWEAWLDVPAGGLDEYQALLPRAKRQRVAADLRSAEDSGMQFDVGPLTGDFNRISVLLARHERKYDPSYNGPDNGFVSYLELCAAVPGAYRIAAFVGGIMVGAAVVFHYRDVLWVRLVGVDDARPDTRGCYFNIVYYQAIQLAHRLSARAVHLGTGSLTTKAWRGARIEPLWAAAVTGPGRDRQIARAGITDHAHAVLNSLPERFQSAPTRPAEHAA
jgi:predicted N-acyltransferase